MSDPKTVDCLLRMCENALVRYLGNQVLSLETLKESGATVDLSAMFPATTRLSCTWSPTQGVTWQVRCPVEAYDPSTRRVEPDVDQLVAEGRDSVRHWLNAHINQSQEST